MKILLGVSGSIAAKLNSRLELALMDSGHEVQVVATKSSEHFKTASWKCIHHNDECEWHDFKYNETVLHINLVKWADLFLVAPCTGNTYNKIRVGLADNLLTNCALAWDYKKPLVIAPAMNTQMWSNSSEHYWLSSRMPTFINPQEKTLYCGDTGVGAMAEISDIVAAVNLYNLQD